MFDIEQLYRYDCSISYIYTGIIVRWYNRDRLWLLRRCVKTNFTKSTIRILTKFSTSSVHILSYLHVKFYVYSCHGNEVRDVQRLTIIDDDIEQLYRYDCSTSNIYTPKMTIEQLTWRCSISDFYTGIVVRCRTIIPVWLFDIEQSCLFLSNSTPRASQSSFLGDNNHRFTSDVRKTLITPSFCNVFCNVCQHAPGQRDNPVSRGPHGPVPSSLFNAKTSCFPPQLPWVPCRL